MKKSLEKIKVILEKQKTFKQKILMKRTITIVASHSRAIEQLAGVQHGNIAGKMPENSRRLRV